MTRSREEATPEWRAQEARRTAGFPVSVFHQPDLKSAGSNTGYIMVAVTSCCRSWNLTRLLLQSLVDMDDPIHVVLMDDNSVDGAQEEAARLGIPVLSTGRMTGNTMNFVRAWKYFTSYDGLQFLVVLNNDITVTPGTFTKMYNCANSPMPQRRSGAFTYTL